MHSHDEDIKQQKSRYHLRMLQFFIVVFVLPAFAALAIGLIEHGLKGSIKGISGVFAIVWAGLSIALAIRAMIVARIYFMALRKKTVEA